LKVMKAKSFSDDELLNLHRKGLTDAEIAEKLSVTQAAVNYRRVRLGLKNNYKRNTFTDDELLKYYHMGFSDKEISLRLGVTAAAVNYRRGRLGLASNVVAYEKYQELFASGLSDEEIAVRLKVSYAAVASLRMIAPSKEAEV
jgi:DNA-binding NarL/FixJ family response regulator